MPSKRKQYRYLYNFAGDFLYVSSKTPSSNHDVCDRMAIYLVTSTLKVLLLIAVSFSFIIVAPTYKNVFTVEEAVIWTINSKKRNTFHQCHIFLWFFLRTMLLWTLWTSFHFICYHRRNRKCLDWFWAILGCIQNGPKVHIGPFAQLNYETATKVNW